MYLFLNILLKIFLLGIGDWGLGIGDWGFGPKPKTQNPKTPNPKPQEK